MLPLASSACNLGLHRWLRTREVERPHPIYNIMNKQTIVKNAYPLHLIPDIMNRIAAAKAKYFTKLDICWGYNNVRIKEGDEWKAAFWTNRGLFEPLVMFSGLTNSPATFQMMMNNLFKTLIDESVIVVYMDDILIFTESLEQHHETVWNTLEILRTNHQMLLHATES